MSFCDQVILVTGHRSNELYTRYHHQSGIRLCFNPDYRDGMFSSIKAGAQSLESPASSFFLIPGDMPEVKPETWRLLWAAGPSSHALVPRYDNGHGHPVLLPPEMIKLITTAPPDTNLGQLIAQTGRRAIEVNDPGIHLDLDTPERYQWLSHKLHQL